MLLPKIPERVQFLLEKSLSSYVSMTKGAEGKKQTVTMVPNAAQMSGLPVPSQSPQNQMTEQSREVACGISIDLSA